jgi:uncharacterized PurR-regulated membrane protein YhhQ (DUF165 family)
MINYFEINHLKKIYKINLFLLTIYLSISIAAHIIANRLVIINGYPIISAGFIYMAVFVLTDVFASFNSRKLVMYIIFCEAFANLIVILYTTWISGMPYPEYFHKAEAYKQVFQPVIVLYIANLGGTIISAIIDLFIFYYLYKQKRWSFFLSSFASSIITISCYTFVTDYFGFRISYPNMSGY